MDARPRHPAPVGRGDDKRMGSVICPDCGGSDFRHIAQVELLRRVIGFDQAGTLVVDELPVAEVGGGPYRGRLVCASCDAELDLPDDISFL